MTLPGGYWRKMLFVDLSSEETMIATFNEDFARKYLGGVGFAARMVAAVALIRPPTPVVMSPSPGL